MRMAGRAARRHGRHPHLETKIVDGDGSDRAAPNAGQILKRAGRGSPQPVAINSYQGR
jgi:hypothetical protein